MEASKVIQNRRRRHALNVTGFILIAVWTLFSDEAILKQYSWSSDRKFLMFHPTTAPPPRWNASQLDEHFDNLTAFNDAELLQVLPKPLLNSVELYNRDAWHRLRELLGFESNSSLSIRKNSTTICFSGGSTTAGGGVGDSRRYDIAFGTFVNITQKKKETRNIRIVNRGHGARGGAHTAYLLPNFIPADTDILVWEFSQNDMGEYCRELQKELTTFLDHVKHYFAHPPVVMLVYIWSAPFRVTVDDPPEILNKEYDCHRRIGAMYDFVAGSVYAGAYVTNLRLDFDTAKERFLADAHHPNPMGHRLMAFLLWDLVTDEERGVVGIEASSPPEEPRWDCKEDSEGKTRIMDIANNQFAFASWTSETPQNEGHQCGMMYPRLMANAESAAEPSAEKDMTSILHGKAGDYRKDRKFSVVLPCCNAKERIVFDVRRADEGTTSCGTMDLAADIQGTGAVISAIQFHSPEVSWIDVERWVPVLDTRLLQSSVMISFLDAQGETMFKGNVAKASSKGKATVEPEWVIFNPSNGEQCGFTYFTQNTWLLLPKDARMVSRIDVCNKNEQCGGDGSRNISLMHLILF